MTIETITKEVRRQEKVFSRTVCDQCFKTTEKKNEKGWFHTYSGHHEWGNDSLDSRERHDLCGAKCYFKRMKHIYDAMKDDGYFDFYFGDLDADEIKEILDFIKVLI